MFELQAILMYNKQATFGYQIDLCDRAADAVVYGAIERCPECIVGTPIYNLATGRYKCEKKVNPLDMNKFTGCGRVFASLKRDKFINLEQDKLN